MRPYCTECTSLPLPELPSPVPWGEFGGITRAVAFALASAKHGAHSAGGVRADADALLTAGAALRRELTPEAALWGDGDGFALTKPQWSNATTEVNMFVSKIRAIMAGGAAGGTLHDVALTPEERASKPAVETARVVGCLRLTHGATCSNAPRPTLVA
jgi:hypothetical protein